MGWNEPPSGQRPNDSPNSSGDNGDRPNNPWGDRGGKGGRNDGPPDLDEVVRKLQARLGGIFGKRPPVHSSGGGSDGGGTGILLLAAAGILVVWLVFDMFHVIDQQERGVVLRFGEYQTTLQPGLSMRLPRPLERVIKVNTGQVNTIGHQTTMLTRDENIVEVDVSVQWRVGDPVDYLFEVSNPIGTLRQALESSIREVIGRSEIDFVLVEGRREVEASQRDLLQQILDDYKTGIEIVSVAMQSANPPDQVRDAFDDAIKAREDEQRSVNEAEAYRNEIIPRARGQAARMMEESNGYKERVIARAKGEANRFSLLLGEYQMAPEVTRQRIYLDMMEQVLSNNSKVLLDNDGGNSLLYLPIDKMIDRMGKSTGKSHSQTTLQPMPGTSTSNSSESRFNQRDRGVR
ncbi:MAG: FtsH protease activity modulator HflK [Gammaproteobacteria bacterium]